MSRAKGRAARILRQTMTIARRDFIATVFTPTFLVFLLAPLIMVGFGAIGGLGAATMADSSTDRIRMVAFVDPATGARLTRADTDLRALYRLGEAPPPLEIRPVAADPAAAAGALFKDNAEEVTAALYGPLERPTVLHGTVSVRHANYLAALAERTLRDERAGSRPLSSATIEAVARQGATRSGQQAAGFAATFAIFVLTLMLAGQTVGMLAEERNSKVIEVLAAAVPLEAVFFGKLVGMFGVALLFVGFWGTLVTQGAQMLPGEIASGLGALSPSMGFAPFALIFLAYFSLAFLLLGAVFLGVGAQAATMREIQMLSLPITIFMVGMFGVSAAGAAAPDSTLALVTQIFPFSSPFAMVARAANAPEIWPHLLAIVWQALWLAITITIGARAFRRGVLQSGSGKMKLSSLFGRS